MQNQFRSLRTKNDKRLHRLIKEGAPNKKQVKKSNRQNNKDSDKQK